MKEKTDAILSLLLLFLQDESEESPDLLRSSGVGIRWLPVSVTLPKGNECDSWIVSGSARAAAIWAHL